MGMAALKTPESSLRVEQAEVSRLVWAFVFSLALHLLLFGSFEVGQKFGWWQRMYWPAWFKTSKSLMELLKKKQSQQAQHQDDITLVFVAVSPMNATPAPPN